jgi:hypothetical protein
MVARNKKSDFAGWDEQKQKRVFKRVREISIKYGIKPSAGVSFAVNKVDYDDILPVDLRNALGGDHYAWTVRYVISMLDKWRLAGGIGPLEYVFDWIDAGTPRRTEIDTIMQQAEAQAVYLGKLGEYTNYSFRKRKDIPALQCVDAMAWTCYTQSLLTFYGTPPSPLSVEAWHHYGGHLEGKGWLQAFAASRDQLQDWVDGETRTGNRTLARLVEWEKSKTYLP